MWQESVRGAETEDSVQCAPTEESLWLVVTESESWTRKEEPNAWLEDFIVRDNWQLSKWRLIVWLKDFVCCSTVILGVCNSQRLV
jgi:hypothetical protein